MLFLPSLLGWASEWAAPATLATCSASPLIGRREAALWLLCASASSREPGSEVAWLWTAPLPWKLHPPSLPSPSSQSHWGEQRNRGDRRERGLWPGYAALPPHSIPHRECQLPKPDPRPSPVLPSTLGDPPGLPGGGRHGVN